MQTYAFAAPVLRLETTFRYHFLPVPADVGEALWNAGTRRLIATLNGHDVRRALLRTAEGHYHVLVGLPLLRTIGAREGDLVAVDLRPDPEPNRIDLDEAFAAILDQDEEAAARFFAFTPGRQRSLASYVTSAKRPETRVKRALELAEKIKTHTLYGDQVRPE